MATIHVTGDSHLAAMAQGARTLDAAATGELAFYPLGRGGVVPQRFFDVDEAEGVVRIVAEEWHPLSFPVPDASGDVRRGDLYCVCLPCNTSRFLRDYDWVTYVPWQLKESSSEAPISDAVLERMIGGDVDQALAFVEALKTVGLDVCVADSPRYFKHANYLRRTRLDVCVFLSEAYRSYVAKRLDAMEIPVIAQRPETIGADGETLADYRREQRAGKIDQQHANAEFGAMMVEDLLAYAANRPKNAASAA